MYWSTTGRFTPLYYTSLRILSPFNGGDFLKGSHVVREYIFRGLSCFRHTSAVLLKSVSVGKDCSAANLGSRRTADSFQSLVQFSLSILRWDSVLALSLTQLYRPKQNFIPNCKHKSVDLLIIFSFYHLSGLSASGIQPLMEQPKSAGKGVGFIIKKSSINLSPCLERFHSRHHFEWVI